MRLTALLALVSAMAFALQAQARPHVPAARVVDRTMVCAAALSGGVYEVEVEVRAGAGRRRSSWAKPATTIVTTGSTGSAAEALDNALGWAIAGEPTRDATVIPNPYGNFSYPVRAWGTLAMTNRCRVSRTRPPLSARGLRGGAVDGLGQIVDCPSPRRILLRVRAVLAADSSLSTRRGNLATTTPLTEARVVVSTQGGKRLAYTEVNASGKARLFTAPGCIPD